LLEKNPAKRCIVPIVGIENSTSPYLELSTGAKQSKYHYREIDSFAFTRKN
jgi:hypothetical protein